MRETDFEAVYGPGFLIQNPSMVTALSLIFEKVYLPNQLDSVIEFSKNFRIIRDRNEGGEERIEMKIEPVGHSDEKPFKELSEEEKDTAYEYLRLAKFFSMDYSPLFMEGVFNTNLYEEGDPLEVDLIEENPGDEKNIYEVRERPMHVTKGGDSKVKRLIDRGAVPVLDKTGLGNFIPEEDRSTLSSRYLASLLAMKSIEIVLPRTSPADAETILEAREKLSDLLPSFWASMLEMSSKIKERVSEDHDPEDLIFECREIVDTEVRPSLVEIRNKMELERKS